MRLDKFLKVSRLIKRRTVATGVCASERILVNGNTAKPAKQIKASDVITICFQKPLTIRVLEVPEGNIPLAKAPLLYEIL